jgi:hypothetical protein
MSDKEGSNPEPQESYDPVLENWQPIDTAIAVVTAGVITIGAVAGAIAILEFVYRKIDKKFNPED